MIASLDRVCARSLRRRHAGVLAFALGAVTLLVPHASHAFCRTTTTPVPPSYSPTNGCFTQGLPLFWRGACVGYTINAKASAIVPLTEATRVIDAAFATWNAAMCSATGSPVGITTSNLGVVTCGEVRYNPYGPNQNVVVFRDDKWPYNDPNNTLGLTTVTFNADNGEIFDTDMEINASDKNLTTSTIVPPTGFDLLSVITHEAGHFLGLAHATDSKATMFASYRPGTSALRTLTEDDIAGLCDVYPSASSRSVATTVAAGGTVPATACDPSPRHGFSATCEANPAPTDQNAGSRGCAIAPPSGDQGAGGAALAMGAALGVLLAKRRRARQVA